MALLVTVTRAGARARLSFARYLASLRGAVAPAASALVARVTRNAVVGSSTPTAAGAEPAILRNATLAAGAASPAAVAPGVQRNATLGAGGAVPGGFLARRAHWLYAGPAAPACSGVTPIRLTAKTFSDGSTCTFSDGSTCQLAV